MNRHNNNRYMIKRIKLGIKKGIITPTREPTRQVLSDTPISEVFFFAIYRRRWRFVRQRIDFLFVCVFFVYEAIQFLGLGSSDSLMEPAR